MSEELKLGAETGKIDGLAGPARIWEICEKVTISVNFSDFQVSDRSLFGAFFEVFFCETPVRFWFLRSINRSFFCEISVFFLAERWEILGSGNAVPARNENPVFQIPESVRKYTKK